MPPNRRRPHYASVATSPFLLAFVLNDVAVHLYEATQLLARRLHPRAVELFPRILCLGRNFEVVAAAVLRLMGRRCGESSASQAPGHSVSGIADGTVSAPIAAKPLAARLCQDAMLPRVAVSQPQMMRRSSARVSAT